MRAMPLLTLVLIASIAVGGEPTVKKMPFTGQPGAVPTGWKVDRTGKDKLGSDWKLVEDKEAPGGPLVLAQVAADPKAIFNLCIVDAPKLKDVDLTVSFKAIKGETDQGGGLVWRYQDGNNYYVARMNPLEDNFRLYKVVDGKRLQLATANVKDGDTGKWHTLRVTMDGKAIKCWFNGKLYLEAMDETFADVGRIGVWSKADAQTQFADLRVGGK